MLRHGFDVMTLFNRCRDTAIVVFSVDAFANVETLSFDVATLIFSVLLTSADVTTLSLDVVTLSLDVTTLS